MVYWNAIKSQEPNWSCSVKKRLTVESGNKLPHEARYYALKIRDRVVLKMLNVCQETKQSTTQNETAQASTPVRHEQLLRRFKQGLVTNTSIYTIMNLRVSIEDDSKPSYMRARVPFLLIRTMGFAIKKKSDMFNLSDLEQMRSPYLIKKCKPLRHTTTTLHLYLPLHGWYELPIEILIAHVSLCCHTHKHFDYWSAGHSVSP